MNASCPDHLQLASEDLGRRAADGSGIICVAIVGGAIVRHPGLVASDQPALGTVRAGACYASSPRSVSVLQCRRGDRRRLPLPPNSFGRLSHGQVDRQNRLVAAPARSLRSTPRQRFAAPASWVTGSAAGSTGSRTGCHRSDHRHFLRDRPAEFWSACIRRSRDVAGREDGIEPTSRRSNSRPRAPRLFAGSASAAAATGPFGRAKATGMARQRSRNSG